MLFGFAILVIAGDLGSKAWATAQLASPVHPMVIAAGNGQTVTALLAGRGIDGEQAAKIKDNMALLRLQHGKWQASEPVLAGQIGREIIADHGTGFASPRATRLRSRDLGKPLQEVLAEAWRVEPGEVQALLATAWQPSDEPVALDKPLADGEALAVMERTMVLIPNWMHFVYAENPGAAFSFLTSAPALVRHLLFTVISGLAALALSWWLWRGQLGSTLSSYALAGILGGAVGNVVDRLHYHVVIDFIYNFIIIDGKTHGWPVYNVADIGITVGVILIALESLIRKQPVPAPVAKPAV